MSDWQSMETAPWQKLIEVKNDLMDEPVLATRGYATSRGVHPDMTYCTTSGGRLVCPTEWRPVQQEAKDNG